MNTTPTNTLSPTVAPAASNGPNNRSPSNGPNRPPSNGPNRPPSNGPNRPQVRCASPAIPPLVAANNTQTSGPTRNQQNSENSDRNNNATPPNRGQSIPPVPPALAIPNARRTSQQRCSPPVGARPNKQDLPPGAAPLGSIPRAPQPPSSNSSSQGISVPLLASQLGRPVNLGERGPHQPPSGGLGGLLGPGMPPLSPHHLSLLSHTLSPFSAIPMGNGRFMARNINGTCK